jgi:WD40 repeat protein
VVTATWPILHRVPFSLAFTTNGNRLVVGLDGRVKLHDAASGEVLANFEQPGAAFRNVAVSPDGRFVAASSQSHRVQIWDLNTHRERTLIDVKQWVHDLTFSPDGNQLAVVSKGGRMTLWDVEAEKSESRISKSETNSK